MADLDTYKDKIIVFEAVKASDTSRVFTRQRQPLQPTNAQLLSLPKGSSHEPVDIKQSFDGASDENHTPTSAMPCGSLHPSRAMHGQALHSSGAQSNSYPLSPLSDRMSQAPTPHSHASGSTFQPSKRPHSSVRSHLTSHSGATSDHADGSVNMAGFDRYYAIWHDRVQVSYPDYDESTHIRVF